MHTLRPLNVAIAISLALLAVDAAAQARSLPARDTISSVQVSAPARPVYQEHLDAVRGVYALSNGWRMEVSPSADGIVAQVGRQRAMRLVALSPDKFASRDGHVTMEFNRGSAGDEMLMSYIPDSRVAQVILVKATLAQR